MIVIVNTFEFLYDGPKYIGIGPIFEAWIITNTWPERTICYSIKS